MKNVTARSDKVGSPWVPTMLRNAYTRQSNQRQRGGQRNEDLEEHGRVPALEYGTREEQQNKRRDRKNEAIDAARANARKRRIRFSGQVLSPIYGPGDGEARRDDQQLDPPLRKAQGI